jgi:8-amino-7-oxononanoate synthase
VIRAPFPSGVAPASTGVAGRPGASTWSAWVDQSTDAVVASGRWRRPRAFDAAGPAGRLDDPSGPSGARHVVSFASNDYLGLACHPVVVAAAHGALDRWGAGSGASRLVTGSRPVHTELEAALAAWKGCERAVVFPTGFAANLSVLTVFGAEGAHIFSDELNHASIVDGCRLARAEVTVYPHGRLDLLDQLLSATTTGRPIVVSDTVFSMDGDGADLSGLLALARRHGALLVLDEAHAVLGPELDVGPEGGVTSGDDLLRVGTLSKTLGSLGGFVAGPARYTEYLVNRARPYIFTTAPTPADTAAALAAVGVVRSSEGALLRARLAGHVARVATALGRSGRWAPIIPVVVGAEADAVAASEQLLGAGVWVPAIRPPTVAPGTSRLRITVSADHTDEQVDRLIGGLVSAGLAAPVRRHRGAGAP